MWHQSVFQTSSVLLLIKNIFDSNSFSSDDSEINQGKIVLSIHGFISFINHSKKVNVERAGTGHSSLNIYVCTRRQRGDFISEDRKGD